MCMLRPGVVWACSIEPVKVSGGVLGRRTENVCTIQLT